MPDIYDFALNLLRQNPEKADTPLGRQLMQILESKDYSAGEQLGKNLCNTYGVDPKTCYEKGKSFFGI